MAKASGSHQVVIANGASGREGGRFTLVPLVVFWAIGHEEYLLSALFGVVFTALADPGGSYGHRASHTAVFGLIGQG
jgi:hypothetical protein